MTFSIRKQNFRQLAKKFGTAIALMPFIKQNLRQPESHA
jgi:hypothetical protein